MNGIGRRSQEVGRGVWVRIVRLVLIELRPALDED